MRSIIGKQAIFRPHPDQPSAVLRHTVKPFRRRPARRANLFKTVGFPIVPEEPGVGSHPNPTQAVLKEVVLFTAKTVRTTIRVMLCKLIRPGIKNKDALAKTAHPPGRIVLHDDGPQPGGSL